MTDEWSMQNVPPKPIAWHRGAWRGLSWKNIDWDPEKMRNEGTCLIQQKDRVLRRLDTSAGVGYLKFFREEGRLPLRRFLHWIRERICGPMVFRIARMHERLLASGFICAHPWLAAVSSTGEELFLASELKGKMLVTYMRETPEQTDALLERFLPFLRRLHLAGFLHGDCNPGNFLLTTPEGSSFSLLDNDRTCIRHGLLLRRGIRRNLIQFFAHIPDQAYQEDRLSHWLELYFGMPSSSEVTALIPKIQKRRTALAQERARNS